MPDANPGPADPADNQQWRQAPEALTRRSLEGVLLLAPGVREPFALTGTAAIFWDLFADARTVDDALVELNRMFGVPLDQLHLDFRSTMDVLVEAGALHPAE